MSRLQQDDFVSEMNLTFTASYQVHAEGRPTAWVAMIFRQGAQRFLFRMTLFGVAVDGGEAVAMATTNPYDVVLMDIQMPVMDGVEAAAAIRAALADAPTPYMIAITANALTGEREKYLAEGLDDYLAKPLRRADLAAALRRSQDATIKVFDER